MKSRQKSSQLFEIKHIQYKVILCTEFDIIRQYFTHPVNQVVLGIGDDAALISTPTKKELVISVDTLVSGQHFFADTDPCKLGHKALAVNLSDMAAMGAKSSLGNACANLA